jgi:hypothetical protein
LSIFGMEVCILWSVARAGFCAASRHRIAQWMQLEQRRVVTYV